MMSETENEARAVPNARLSVRSRVHARGIAAFAAQVSEEL